MTWTPELVLTLMLALTNNGIDIDDVRSFRIGLDSPDIDIDVNVELALTSTLTLTLELALTFAQASCKMCSHIDLDNLLGLSPTSNQSIAIGHMFTI